MDLSIKRAWLGLLVISGLIYASLLPYSYIGIFGDDAVYVAGAQSLLHGSYTASYDFGPPHAPVYPPGFSLFLAPFAAAVGTHVQLLKWLSLILTLISGAMTFSLARSWLSSGQSLLAMAIYLFNPATLSSSPLVMSESLLTTLILASFICLQRIERSGKSWAGYLLGGLLGWVTLVRYPGFVLTPAVATGLLAAKRRREAIQSTLISLVMSAALLSWNLHVDHQWTGYTSAWRQSIADVAHPVAFLIQWQRATHMIFVNDVLSAPLPDSLIGFGTRTLLAAIVLVLVAAGLRPGKERPDASRGLLLAVVAFVLMWYVVHMFWTSTYSRYALPTLPFVGILMMMGCSRLVRKSPGPPPKAWIAFGCLITLFYAYGCANVVQRAISANPLRRMPAMTYQWIRENVPPQVPFLFAKPSEIYLYTGHPGLWPQIANGRDDFRYLLLTKGIGYILARPCISTSINATEAWNLNQRWAASWPEAFRKVYANPGEATAVYEVAGNPRYVQAFELYRQAARDFSSSAVNEGLNKLKRALALDPQMVSALNAYGAGCLLAGRNLKIAEAILQEAIRLQPGHALALFNLARVYEQTGRPDLARVRLEEARRAAQASTEFAFVLPMIEHGV